MTFKLRKYYFHVLVRTKIINSSKHFSVTPVTEHEFMLLKIPSCNIKVSITPILKQGEIKLKHYWKVKILKFKIIAKLKNQHFDRK